MNIKLAVMLGTLVTAIAVAPVAAAEMERVEGEFEDENGTICSIAVEVEWKPWGVFTYPAGRHEANVKGTTVACIAVGHLEDLFGGTIETCEIPNGTILLRYCNTNCCDGGTPDYLTDPDTCRWARGTTTLGTAGSVATGWVPSSGCN